MRYTGSKKVFIINKLFESETVRIQFYSESLFTDKQRRGLELKVDLF